MSKGLIMEKKLIALVVVAVLFGIGVGLLLSKGHEDFKMAVVDVNRIVNASSQVTALKAEEAVKIQELQNFVQKVQQEAAAEKDEAKKKEIIGKYEKDILLKKNAIESDYAKKLQQIDADITKVIREVAQKKGMTVVVAKNNVIFGGDDITNIVLEEIK
jgi:outer membrane protein